MTLTVQSFAALKQTLEESAARPTKRNMSFAQAAREFGHDSAVDIWVNAGATVFNRLDLEYIVQCDVKFVFLSARK